MRLYPVSDCAHFTVNILVYIYDTYSVECTTRSWLRSLHHAKGKQHENLFFIISLLSLYSAQVCKCVCVCVLVKVVIVSVKQEIEAIKNIHSMIACARIV